ncbi:uncharacterized protein UTRI_10482 [Ustilago trichophora]|uniref:Uncharacterized protein n=1 Tax=Ustilago trichophora TaxID=86804 RepID=A0A5C3EBG4_9BASI|nr:uncharacterized protein UTRI_10482 [Ustilago trichophora]
MRISFIVVLVAIFGGAATVSSAPLAWKAAEEAAKDVGSRAGSSASVDDLSEIFARLRPITAPKATKEELEADAAAYRAPRHADRSHSAWSDYQQAGKRTRAPETPRSSGSRTKH